MQTMAKQYICEDADDGKALYVSGCRPWQSSLTLLDADNGRAVFLTWMETVAEQYISVDADHSHADSFI
jgi:hypothetical protein